jgi:hypothetical protein
MNPQRTWVKTLFFLKVIFLTKSISDCFKRCYEVTNIKLNLIVVIFNRRALSTRDLAWRLLQPKRYKE